MALSIPITLLGVIFLLPMFNELLSSIALAAMVLVSTPGCLFFQDAVSQNIGQVFLGTNLKCASCHDSRINYWGIADVWALASVFADEPLTDGNSVNLGDLFRKSDRRDVHLSMGELLRVSTLFDGPVGTIE